MAQDADAEIRRLRLCYVYDDTENIRYIARLLHDSIVKSRFEEQLKTTNVFPGSLMYRLVTGNDGSVTRKEYSDKNSMEQIAAQVNVKAGSGVHCSVAGFFSVFGYDLSFGTSRIQCELTQY